MFSFDWKDFLSKISAIFITNDGLKDWFLTQVFGSKSHFKDTNFVRDLIDNALSIMGRTIPKEKHADYVATSIEDAINGIIDELTSVFSILRQDVVYGDEKFHKDIYLRYIVCKKENCSTKEMEGIFRDAITFVNYNKILVGGIGYLPSDDAGIEIYLQNLAPYYSVNKNVEYITETAKAGGVDPKEIGDQISTEFNDIVQYYKFRVESNDAVNKKILENLKNNPVSPHLLAINNGEGEREVYYPCPDNQVMYYYKKLTSGQNGNYLKEEIKCTNY